MSGRASLSEAARRDHLVDTGRILGLLAVFLVLDRLTLRIADHGPTSLQSATLLLGSLVSHPAEFGVVFLGLAAVVSAGGARSFSRWSSLELGGVARVAAIGGALWLAWGTSGYAFNYVLGSWHAIDRLVVVVLACGVAFRPVFLLPFLLQVRVLNDQFEHPLGADFGEATDELAVLVLLLISAAHLTQVVTRSWRPSVIVLLTSTIVASHFLEPGLGKVSLDWLALNRISELPLNAKTAGWMADPPNLFAERMSDAISPFDSPIRFATLLMELGAIVAVTHYRLLSIWLPALMAFHVATFAMTGFFFPDWMAIEAGLLVLMLRTDFRAVVEENATAARALLAIAVVALGGLLYHPPRLAWLDAPVAYGYELHAVGESGTQYRLPHSVLAPFTSDVLFGTLALTAHPPLSGGYGAVASEELLRRLRNVSDFEGLAALEEEGERTAADRLATSERVLVALFEHLGRADRARFPGLLERPARFWSSGTSSPAPDESLSEISVVQITSINLPNGREERRRTVFTVTSRGGTTEVIVRAGAGRP